MTNYMRLVDMTMEFIVDYKDQTIVIWRNKVGKRKAVFTIGTIQFDSMAEAKAEVDSW